jgi:protein gp37
MPTSIEWCDETNAWLGATITNQPDADAQLDNLMLADAPVLFVSHEPLLGAINMTPWLPKRLDDGTVSHEPLLGAINMTPWLPKRLDDGTLLFSYRLGIRRFIKWGILGAMTGRGAIKPEPGCVGYIMGQYQAAGVPLFMKDNLWPHGDHLVRPTPARYGRPLKGEP